MSSPLSRVRPVKRTSSIRVRRLFTQARLEGGRRGTARRRSRGTAWADSRAPSWRGGELSPFASSHTLPSKRSPPAKPLSIPTHYPRPFISHGRLRIPSEA